AVARWRPAYPDSPATDMGLQARESEGDGVISYIFRRLLLMIPVALLVTVVVFALARLSPADPALVIAGEQADPAVLTAIREQLGLDKPLPVQHVAWLSRVVRGALGRSFQTRQRVLEAITERLPATIELGAAALPISVTF